MNLTTPWTATNGHTNGAADKIEDVRNVLGREAEHLAQVAAQIGRDAGTHADSVVRDVARDAQKQTNATVSRFADIAAALGPSIAAIGRQRMRQVGEQAQSLGHDLRQVRITTEPKKNDSTPGVALLGGLGIGVGIGIAAMWLFDPQRGQERRAALKARFVEWTSSGRAKATDAIASVRESVTTGTGSSEDDYIEEPLVAEETVSYETWPEGTRVPTV